MFAVVVVIESTPLLAKIFFTNIIAPHTYNDGILFNGRQTTVEQKYILTSLYKGSAFIYNDKQQLRFSFRSITQYISYKSTLCIRGYYAHF